MPAQLQVSVKDISCLEHTSYIDTSKLITMSLMETQNVVDAHPDRAHKGALTPAMRTAIKAFIQPHGIMPNYQMQIVAQNL